MKQSVQESKKLYPGGHNEPAFALSFPSLEVRGCCLLCAASSGWRIHTMDLEKTLQHEIERGTKIMFNISCAEIQTEAKLDRLEAERALAGF